MGADRRKSSGAVVKLYSQFKLKIPVNMHPYAARLMILEAGLRTATRTQTRREQGRGQRTLPVKIWCASYMNIYFCTLLGIRVSTIV